MMRCWLSESGAWFISILSGWFVVVNFNCTSSCWFATKLAKSSAVMREVSWSLNRLKGFTSVEMSMANYITSCVVVATGRHDSFVVMKTYFTRRLNYMTKFVFIFHFDDSSVWRCNFFSGGLAHAMGDTFKSVFGSNYRNAYASMLIACNRWNGN